MFTKDQNTRGNHNSDCNRKEMKAVKVKGVNMVEIWTGVPLLSLVMSLSQKTITTIVDEKITTRQLIEI